MNNVVVVPEAANGSSPGAGSGSATLQSVTAVAAARVPRTGGGGVSLSSSSGITLDDEVPEPAVSILMKMEQMNTSNELDSRSVASIRTGSSSSGGAPTDSFSPRQTFFFCFSCCPTSGFYAYSSITRFVVETENSSNNRKE